MNVNENLVKKADKEEEVFEEEEEIELEDDSNNSKKDSYKDSAKKRMIKTMGFILAGTVLLLIIMFIVSLFTSRKYDYEDIEKVLVNAAESYFKDYPESLPQEDGSVVEIDSSNLVAAEKMKDLSEYAPKDVACTGSVQVEKSGSEYLYTPYLNCGDN